MNIVMPMAGRGQRFLDAGYRQPKPFIDVHGVCMYRHAIAPFVTESDNVILITQDYQRPYFEAESDSILQSKKVFLQAPTEGAACSVLAARSLIDNDEPLLIVNSDQIVRFNRLNWTCLVNNTNAEGIIFTFIANGSKWSYVRLDEALNIMQVAEKVEISPFATCGAYWWRHGSSFCAAADSMIEENIRVNNEFYVAPVYNKAIEEGYIVLPFEVDDMISLGTPELLKDYLAVRRTK